MKFTSEQISKIENMALIQCHVRTIAEVIGCDEKELRQNKPISALIKKKRAEGRVELHKTQFNMRKQPVMAIWLGKQHLEQADKQELGGIGGKVLIPKIILFGDRDKDKKQIVDS